MQQQQQQQQQSLIPLCEVGYMDYMTSLTVKNQTFRDIIESKVSLDENLRMHAKVIIPTEEQNGLSSN